MRFITVTKPGSVDVLTLAEGPKPVPGEGQVLVRVHAAALNRADTLQRQGIYVPPPDQSSIMGVEVAGEVVALGGGCSTARLGGRVMGLIPGGGYADYCLMPDWAAVVIPEGLSYTDAAALPEACYTAHEAMIHHGGLKQGQTVLVHAGASGMGSMALQMARHLGNRCLFTVGCERKRQRCLELGGTLGILYKQEDFAARVLAETEGRGVDLVVDFLGAPYFDRNLEVLATNGTLMLVGVLGGWEGSVNLLPIIMKRVRVKGFSMRGQSDAAKAHIVSRFRETWLAPVKRGELYPVIHSTWPMERVADAHREMEANLNVGKILLTFS